MFIFFPVYSLGFFLPFPRMVPVSPGLQRGMLCYIQTFSHSLIRKYLVSNPFGGDVSKFVDGKVREGGAVSF